MNCFEYLLAGENTILLPYMRLTLKMLVCRAPTYSPKTGPLPKIILRTFFILFFFFFSNSVNKPFFNIIKISILIKETVTETVIICILSLFSAFVDLKVIAG